MRYHLERSEGHIQPAGSTSAAGQSPERMQRSSEHHNRLTLSDVKDLSLYAKCFLVAMSFLHPIVARSSYLLPFSVNLTPQQITIPFLTSNLSLED
jgi:hypothetical protein